MLNAIADEAMSAATAGCGSSGRHGGSGGRSLPVWGPGLCPGSAPRCGEPGAVILAGERLGEVPGALTAATRLAQATGARLAWIPRRAGERGAIEAGALPIVLPGGRAGHRRGRAGRGRAGLGGGVAAREPGRDTAQILAAAAAGDIGGAGHRGRGPG